MNTPAEKDLINRFKLEFDSHTYRRIEAKEPQCFTLTGVAAGIMALLHGEGTVEERVGTYASEESHCICCQETSCKFQVELL
ncbi:MAG: hypothetical protein RIB93_10820 [Coleofasciculus sp. D1-CHI-01]|uniref:hypothetical protein n=1 Tax=Coleofasciculus sp. D1-CHI-01 TaxID=3068482 RepID=UPI0032F4A875